MANSGEVFLGVLAVTGIVALVRWIWDKAKSTPSAVAQLPSLPPVHTGLRCGDYALAIPESIAKEPGHNLIKHGQQYTIKLTNDSDKRAACQITIDGKEVGVWLMDARRTFTLERGVNDPGKFTFYALGTADGRMSGLSGDNPDLGVVKVYFVPEKIIHSQILCAAAPCFHDDVGAPAPKKADTAPNLADDSLVLHAATPTFHQRPQGARGGTGLSGYSEQKFNKVDDIPLDYANAVTIQIKLWCVDKPRPL